MESAASLMIAATALGQGKKAIFMPEKGVDYLPDCQMTGDRDYELAKNIFPTETNDTIYELVFWLEKIVLSFFDQRSDEGELELSKLEKSILNIATSIVLNISGLDEELATKLHNIFRTIVLQNLDENQSFEHLTNLRTPENIISFASSFNYKQNKFGTGVRIVKVSIKSDLKKAELNAELCDHQYTLSQGTVAKHINLKWRIMQFYDSRKFAKIKNKIALDFFTNNYIINTFKGIATYKFVVHNMFNLMKKNSGLLDIFTMMNETLKSVVHFFFSTKVTNPIDFHYIMSMLSKLAEIGVDYSHFVKEITISQDFSETSKKEFITKKQEIDEFNVEYKLWKQNKEAKEDLDAKLKKKKKMLGVKWEERELMSKVTKAVKKRMKNKNKKKGGNTPDF